jgi:putative polyketide hydroxylase
MAESNVPVLIVGGGPVGLSASLLLSRHGVRSLLVERHPGTSIHPKARGLNVRTLELFRVWGVEPAVRMAAHELDRARDVAWAPTLLSPETKRAPYGGAGEAQQTDSPTAGAGCAQDKLEPVVLEAARSHGLADLRFGQEVVELVQHDDVVAATVVDSTSGRGTAVCAEWVIAADGAQSPIRSMLGIRMIGPGALGHRMGIYFRADLRDVGRDRPALLYMLSPPEGPGVMAAVNLADLWLYMAPFRPDQGERLEDFTTERCIRLVRSAVGAEELQVEVLSALPWTLSAAIAERFREGRVFLAGDAAHLIPPTGGQAMNVGIQDVHNLAWKLAGRVAGWAGPGLIDTYEAERRPFALAVMEDASRNVQGFGQRQEQFSNRGRVLGVAYDSPAVIPDGSDPPAATNPVIDYIPTARPGSRAPHLWLRRSGEVISTIDLYDTSFVLLTGAAGQAWTAAAERVAPQLGIPLISYVVGQEGDLVDQPNAWPSLYGVGPDGAVLVRPDGHVAWRAATAVSDARRELAAVLRRVVSLNPETNPLMVST